MQIIIESLIILIAGAIQGLTTFGFSLITIPFLSKLVPLKECVPLVVILNFISNAMILIGCIKEVRIKKIMLLLLASITITPFGAYSLKYVNPTYLTLLVGAVLIVFSVLLIFQKTFPIKNESVGYSVAGTLSGFLNGCLSMSGPPVVLFLSNQGVDKNTFRANLAFYFLILNLATLTTYYINDLIYEVHFEKMIFYIPALLIGVFFGIRLSKKLNDTLFKKITLIILLISGIWTVVNVITQAIV